jgi:Na+-driven multidrug efflux pump
MRLLAASSVLTVAATAFLTPTTRLSGGIHSRSIARSREELLRVISDPTEIFNDKEARRSSEFQFDFDSRTVNQSDTGSLSGDSNDDEMDVGTAIFLSNTRENVGLVEALDQVNATPDLVGLTGEALKESVTKLCGAYPENIIALPTTEDTVNAILDESGRAVAAAEAKLLSDHAAAPDGGVDSVVQAESDEALVAPSVLRIVKFAIPAVGVWLCSPLLSLIDTSAVGILSGTVHQAALNPAVAVTDYTALLIAFMYTGTTNLIAAARLKDNMTEGDSPRTKSTLVGVLRLSTFVGAGLGLVLLAFAGPLLRTLIGNDGISPEVFDAAIKYVQIRALGMPAAAVIGSAQAACLGMQDIKSPLYVLVVAAAVNFLGDVLFVGNAHPWIGGAGGAAWATVFSQYAALAMFVRWLSHKGSDLSESKPTLDISTAILELTGPSLPNKSRLKRFKDAVQSVKATSLGRFASERSISSLFARQKRASFSVRGFLHGSLRKRDLVQFPSRETLDDFAPYVIPVTTTMIGRLSAYVAMSHVISSSLGTVSMAAQQVVLSLFYCLTPIADSLSLTAQSFLPSLSESRPCQERSDAIHRTVLNFFKAAGIFGAVMVAAVSCVPLLSGLFTADPRVIALVNMVVPILMVVFSVHPIVCACEGLLLGRKDLGFLGKMYAAFFAVVPLCMLRVKHAALRDASGAINVASVWKVFLGYQLFRTVAWIARLAFLQRQSETIA